MAASVLGASAATGLLIASPGGPRIALAAGAGFFLAVFAFRSPRLVLTPLVVWFVTLGLARRLISGVSAVAVWGDPLLLVGAGTWLVLAGVAARRGPLAGRERLATMVVVLAVLLGVSALNPLQGGLTVGLSGALLVVVPMAAFLVGRVFVDDNLLRRLLVLVAWLGLVVAIYGLYQTFVGFPPWDQRWLAAYGYTALNVGGVIRAFSSFSAASEYAGFLGIAVVIWVALARSLSRASVGAAALGLLGTALWYESSRGIIVLTVAAVGMVFAARAGLTLRRSLFFAVAALLALPLAINRLVPDQFSDNAGGRLSQHQAQGLADPFGTGSTLPGHIDLVAEGIIDAVHNPLGVGVGAVTIAGGKYGGTVRPTEADPGNVAVAAGFPGLLAYLTLVVIAMTRLYRQAERQRDPLSLAALGIITVTFFQWLNGGQYAIAFWPWLLLGWSDARRTRGLDAASLRASNGHVPIADHLQESIGR